MLIALCGSLILLLFHKLSFKLTQEEEFTMLTELEWELLRSDANKDTEKGLSVMYEITLMVVTCTGKHLEDVTRNCNETSG
jgi:hypothetical protein